jgi:hypothetical protein
MACGANEDIGVSPIRYFLGGEGGMIMLSRRYSERVFSNENDVRGEISVSSCRSSLARIAFSELLLRSTFDDAGERRSGDRTGNVRVRGPIHGKFDMTLS